MISRFRNLAGVEIAERRFDDVWVRGGRLR